MTQTLSRAHVAAIGFLAAVTAWLLSQGQALAQAQDYGDLTSGFGSELSAAVPVALAAVGLFIGVILAYKIVRRMLRA